MLLIFYYKYTVQRHKQWCCWNGAVEELNIIILNLINLCWKETWKIKETEKRSCEKYLKKKR